MHRVWPYLAVFSIFRLSTLAWLSIPRSFFSCQTPSILRNNRQMSRAGQISTAEIKVAEIVDCNKTSEVWQTPRHANRWRYSFPHGRICTCNLASQPNSKCILFAQKNLKTLRTKQPCNFAKLQQKRQSHGVKESGGLTTLVCWQNLLHCRPSNPHVVFTPT